MKTALKYALTIICLTIFLWACKQSPKEGVKISGMVENLPDGGFLYLELMGEGGVSKTDTLEVSDEGTFSSYVKISEPAFYRLNCSGRQYVTLILTGKEEEVEVAADGNDPRGFFEVSGSYDTEYKNRMDEVMKAYQESAGSVQQRQIQARTTGDIAAFNDAGNELRSLALDAEKKLKNIIREASPSLAAFYGLQMIDGNTNYAFFDSISTQLSKELPTNQMVANLQQSIEAKRNLAIGAAAPEIALPDPDGELVSLSSLKGKYVLIDFWAAWCRPCRAENPNVVRAYNEYAEHNFEILGVSLDKTKKAWLGAIEQDGLPWLHVSDLKFWNSIAAKTYQISSIPATYLIDPDGKIIAKNLRGASLEAKLKEIFN